MGRNEVVTGFVIYDGRNGIYFAWSSVSNNDIIIDYKYSPQNMNLLGKWVSVAIDDNLEACREASIILDRYETRIFKSKAELLLEVQHDGCYRNRMEMFRHHDLGLIADPEHYVRDVEQNVSYRVWIACNPDSELKRDIGARWVVVGLSEKMDLTRQRSSTQSTDYNSEPQSNDRSYGRSSQVGRRSSPENYSNRRSRSPERSSRFGPRYNTDDRQNYDHRNQDNYGYNTGPPVMLGNRSRRSPSPRNRYQDFLSRDRQNYRNDGGSYQNRPSAHQSPNRSMQNEPYASNQNSHPDSRRPASSFMNQSKNSYCPSPSPSNRSSDYAARREIALQSPKIPSSGHSVPHQRKNTDSPRPPSRAETTSEEDTDNEIEDRSSQKSKISSKQGNLIQNNEPIGEHRQVTDATKISSDRIKSRGFIRQLTPEEEEMKTLRTTVNDIKALVKNLVRHPEVIEAMQVANLEEFEELIEIVERKE
ncbi:hypothetical protein L5515_011524 [Caenorhabditis briggsae]|uniref:Uncharacterized protein n=2 Tax=Caenorhabditis briggsae TaxID=6238 RepID=A0AAE9JH21_CAEBR|nr:hypothetical protein L3Y34_004409 [Caenorhabditis briggsae]UMM28902.1 hypothetical protein L5515_011524 [Caenorhabditis briggsae]